MTRGADPGCADPVADGRCLKRPPRFDELDEAARAELWAVLALRHTEGLGARSHIRLIRHFGSAFAAVQRAPHLAGSGVRQQAAQALASGRWRATAKAEWDALRACDCGILLWNDPRYPERLRSLPDAPALLYCKGDVVLLDNPALGVVGSRLCSRQGMRMAAQLARDLACAGVTIVSGMARGIDREAHLAGLQGVGGTVGVLGTGIDIRYPYDNEDLFERMASEGLLVTEFAPGARPEPRHFPIRNRVISGLSLGVLVVEAATRSGSLITARLALEQGREVYAMPGPVSAQTSRGCHDLLEEGAHAVGSAEDILVDLAPQLLGALRARAEAAEAAGGVPPAAPRGDDSISTDVPLSGGRAPVRAKVVPSGAGQEGGAPGHRGGPGPDASGPHESGPDALDSDASDSHTVSIGASGADMPDTEAQGAATWGGHTLDGDAAGNGAAVPVDGPPGGIGRAKQDAGVGRLMDRLRQHLARHDVPEDDTWRDDKRRQDTYAEDERAKLESPEETHRPPLHDRRHVPPVRDGRGGQGIPPACIATQRNGPPVAEAACGGQSCATASPSRFPFAPLGQTAPSDACPPVASAPVISGEEGATAVSSASLRATARGVHAVNPDMPKEHGDPERRLLALLRDMGEAHVDDLCRALAMAPGDVSGTLLLLEVQGVVRRLPGMRYASM